MRPKEKKGARESAASLFCSTERGLPCIYIAYRTVFFINRALFVKHFWLGTGELYIQQNELTLPARGRVYA